MRKGTRRLLFVSTVSLLALIAVGGVTNQLVSRLICRTLNSLPHLKTSFHATCLASWLRPRARLYQTQVSLPLEDPWQELALDVKALEAELDLWHTVLSGTPQLRLRLGNPTLRVISRAEGADSALALFRLGVAALRIAGPVLASSITSVAAHSGTFLLETITRNQEIVARDFVLEFQRSSAGGFRATFQTRLGTEGAPARLELIAREPSNSLDIVASGYWRLARGLFAEVKNAKLSYTPEALTVSIPDLRLNGAPFNISAKLPPGPTEPGHLTVEWQRFRFAPLVDWLWGDMRGALEGELSGTVSILSPPLEAAADWSRWQFKGTLKGRRMRWSGINLLYGLLKRAHDQLDPTSAGELPFSLRQRFKADLYRAETLVDTLDATLRYTGQELFLDNAELRAPPYRLRVQGTARLTATPPTIRSFLELIPDSELARSLCEIMTAYCHSGEHGDTSLVLRYRWDGALGHALPVWVGFGPPQG